MPIVTVRIEIHENITIHLVTSAIQCFVYFVKPVQCFLYFPETKRIIW